MPARGGRSFPERLPVAGRPRPTGQGPGSPDLAGGGKGPPNRVRTVCFDTKTSASKRGHPAGRSLLRLASSLENTRTGTRAGPPDPGPGRSREAVTGSRESATAPTRGHLPRGAGRPVPDRVRLAVAPVALFPPGVAYTCRRMPRWFRLPFRSGPPRVAVLRLQGVIAASGGGGTLGHAALAPLIERAFRKGRPAAVALAINSPGGSPVQSSLIGAHVRGLADELSLPVHAFVEDVAASGGYWLAASADDVWVDESSLTGSIGVISAGFGFPELLARAGIERRVHTAGEDKSLLDPFRPERPDDVARLMAIQARIHRQFIDHVTARRGPRLQAGRSLFEGEIFVGREAVEAGLADGVAHMGPKLRELYGDRVRTRALGLRRPLLRRLVPGIAAEAVGAGLASGIDALERRAAWARFGL